MSSVISSAPTKHSKSSSVTTITYPFSKCRLDDLVCRRRALGFSGYALERNQYSEALAAISDLFDEPRHFTSWDRTRAVLALDEEERIYEVGAAHHRVLVQREVYLLGSEHVELAAIYDFVTSRESEDILHKELERLSLLRGS